MAQRRHSIQGTNLNPVFSILSISDDQIVTRAAKLGVSLGISQIEKIESAKILKDSELNRITCQVLEKNVALSDLHDPQNLILNRAASLSEDLEEDELARNMEDQLDPIVPLEKIKKRRQRKDYSTSTRRRSVRIKKRNTK